MNTSEKELERRRKISETLRGFKRPPFTKEHRENLSRCRKGKRVSDEVRKLLLSYARGNQHALGRKHSEETKQKMRGRTPWNKGTTGVMPAPWNKGLVGYKAGEGHYNWKGGITLINDQIRQCVRYRKWRSEIFNRDNFTCDECGVCGGYLEVHHKKPLSTIIDEYNIEDFNAALTCDELWSTDNGVTVCLECHKKVDKQRLKFTSLCH